jgi:hypothetical protein
MNGFGFIEYKDAMDARDVVPGMLPTHHAALLNAIDVLTYSPAFRKMKSMCLRNSHSALVVLGIVVQSLPSQCFQVLTYIAG